MKITISLFPAAVAALLLHAWSFQDPKQEEKKPTVRYGVPVVQGPMDSVLLKDYSPESSLTIPETRVPKARFPVIDMHAHVEAETPQQIAQWVRDMDEVGVKQTVVLTGATGEEFDRLAGLFLKSHPNRFILFCGIETSQADAPDFPGRVARELERCHQKGARGVGEVSDKGWGIGGGERAAVPRNRRLHPDDARLDLFWQRCAELRMPVNLHIADHPSCWRPLGNNQERTPDFQVFNLHGKDVPSFEELMAVRDRLLAKHPKTTFIACHLSNQGHDLETLSKALQRFPNLYLDISARDYEIGRQPRAAARFLARYQDRIVFGTDMGREKHMYQAWWRLLEAPDEFIPGRIWWRYYGLELPSPVLEHLYLTTPARLLKK
jgi:predicted TIM-barrel fold metal-dependent hydrolase